MNPPPGWYPDPEGPERARWWDGYTWTVSTAFAHTTKPLKWASILSLIFGVASVAFVWVLGLGIALAILGIIFGTMGLRQSRALAVSGLIVSGFSVLVFGGVMSIVLLESAASG